MENALAIAIASLVYSHAIRPEFMNQHFTPDPKGKTLSTAEFIVNDFGAPDYSFGWVQDGNRLRVNAYTDSVKCFAALSQLDESNKGCFAWPLKATP